MPILSEKINHQNNTKTQKKEGSDGENVQFCSSEQSRYPPKKYSQCISDTNNPSEIERSDDEPEEYSEPYISATDPAREIIEILYWGNYYIGFLFSEEQFYSEPKREKERGEEERRDIAIILFWNQCWDCRDDHLHHIEYHSQYSAQNRILPSRKYSSFSEVFRHSYHSKYKHYYRKRESIRNSVALHILYREHEQERENHEMSSDNPWTHIKKYKNWSKKHPQESHHDFYTQYPSRDSYITMTTSTHLYDAGDERNELIPTKLLLAGEALASSCPKRPLHTGLHEHSCEAPNTTSEEEKSNWN